MIDRYSTPEMKEHFAEKARFRRLFQTGNAAAHGGRVVVVQQIDGQHGRGFGHAIALQQGQAQAQEAAGDGR